MQIRASVDMEERALQQEQKRNGRIIFALCVVLFLPAINNFINSILQIGLEIRLEFLTPASYIFMAFCSGFLLYPHIFRRKSFLIFFVCMFLGVAVSYMLYPEIRGVIYSSPVDLVYSPVNKLFVYCIPSLIGIATLTDFEGLFAAMHKWGRFTVLLGIATYGFVYFYVGKELQYMVYSYFMLLPICVCYEHARDAESKADFLIALAGSVSIVMCGARGAVVSLLMYFALRFMLSLSRRMTRKQLIHLLLIIALLLALLFAYEQLLATVADLFERLGIDSRFIYSLSEHMLLEDSGRSQITEAVFKGIRNNPIGYGLYGDRYIVGTYLYAHNIIWEFLCDFGIVGGTFLLWLLVYRFKKTLKLLSGQPEMRLILSLVSYGIFQLFFSSSFLENVLFFWIVGLIFFVNWRSVSDRL